MTAPRHQRKRARIGLIVAAAVTLATPLLAATTEEIVVDSRTGLAISGFDPVGYFTDGNATQGNAEHEFRHAGAIWRFRNEGNRAAFAANPEVYAPRFGGYDPVAIARGVAVAGHPGIWLIHRDRLYLFYDATARASFGSDPDRYAETADRRWADVLRTLAR